MNEEMPAKEPVEKVSTLSVYPPFIWPDSRDTRGVSTYSETPSGQKFYAEANLVSGVLGGTSDATVKWIEEFLGATEEKKLSLVLVLHPAGPTKKEHLQRILSAVESNNGGKVKADIPKQRITPRPVYNQIGSPDLTANAPDENWNQPLSLLTRSAETFRKLNSDMYFKRNFTGKAFTQREFCSVMDVFGDAIIKGQDKQQALEQLEALKEIGNSSVLSKQKCKEVWSMIKGLNDDK